MQTSDRHSKYVNITRYFKTTGWIILRLTLLYWRKLFFCVEKMAVGFITALVVTLTLTSQVSSQASKSGHCPMARTVTNCINRCKSDFECSFNKKCCVNVCGSTSCAESGPFTHGSDLRDFRNDRNSVYCDNVKCQSGEKCVLDTRTKRNKCGRG